jgi:hypothetical protein
MFDVDEDDGRLYPHFLVCVCVCVCVCLMNLQVCAGMIL